MIHTLLPQQLELCTKTEVQSYLERLDILKETSKLKHLSPNKLKSIIGKNKIYFWEEIQKDLNRNKLFTLIMKQLREKKGINPTIESVYLGYKDDWKNFFLKNVSKLTSLQYRKIIEEVVQNYSDQWMAKFLWKPYANNKLIRNHLQKNNFELELLKKYLENKQKLNYLLEHFLLSKNQIIDLVKKVIKGSRFNGIESFGAVLHPGYLFNEILTNNYI